MTSAKSCKTPSNKPERTWFVEMLRRCKALPILITVAYFLSNILPVLLSYNRLETVILYVYSSITGSNVLNIMIGIAGGVVVSCAVFRYLHSSASVIDAHARPLTRTQLFRGSFFAGLVMIIVPVVLTGVFYLCVMGAHTSVEGGQFLIEYQNTIGKDGVLNVPHIAGWVLDSIVVIGFTYCVSCLAGIFAGTAVIQALLSLLLAALPTLIYLVCHGYMSMFLFGYAGEDTVLKYLSPYGCLLGRGGYLFQTIPAALLIYCGIAVVLAFAAAAVYKRIKLEKEEQTIVVPLAADILVILLTVISASVVLFIIWGFIAESSTTGAIITLLLATIVFFPIYCMISEQSFRIFKGRNVRTLLIYAAVMCVILGCTMFDVTGFEKRVPESSEIESVSVVDNNLLVSEFKGITDEETIALITDLQKSITQVNEDMEKTAEEQTSQSEEMISGIEMKYKLKNGRMVKRSYGEIRKESFDTYAKFYDCQEVRRHECYDTAHAVKTGQYMALNDIHVNREGVANEESFHVAKKYQKGLLEAANKDIMQWTAESKELFVFYDEYDPAKDNSAYGIEIGIDQSMVKDEEVLEGFNGDYRTFTTDDRNLNKYIEDHPELKSKKNLIKDNDPIYGVNY